MSPTYICMYFQIISNFWDEIWMLIPNHVENFTFKTRRSRWKGFTWELISLEITILVTSPICWWFRLKHPHCHYSRKAYICTYVYEWLNNIEKWSNSKGSQFFSFFPTSLRLFYKRLLFPISYQPFMDIRHHKVPKTNIWLQIRRDRLYKNSEE